MILKNVVNDRTKVSPVWTLPGSKGHHEPSGISVLRWEVVGVGKQRRFGAFGCWLHEAERKGQSRATQRALV